MCWQPQNWPGPNPTSSVPLGRAPAVTTLLTPSSSIREGIFDGRTVPKSKAPGRMPAPCLGAHIKATQAPYSTPWPRNCHITLKCAQSRTDPPQPWALQFTETAQREKQEPKPLLPPYPCEPPVPQLPPTSPCPSLAAPARHGAGGSPSPGGCFPSTGHFRCCTDFQHYRIRS